MNLARLVADSDTRSLWLGSLVFSVLVTQTIVIGMSLLLKGTVDEDFIITGLVASLAVASLVMSAIVPSLAALRKSEYHHRLIFSESPLPMWVFEENSLALLDVNNAASELYGYSHDEFLSMTLRDIRPAEDIALLEQTMRNLPPGSYYGEYRHRKKDDTVIDVAIWAKPFNFDGRKARLVLVSDITERKRSESEAARSKQALDSERVLFQAILDNAPLGIWLLGHDGRLQFVNRTFCEAVGISEERFLSASHYVEVLPQAIAANCTRSDQECFRQDTPHFSLEWLPFVDGKEHQLEITKVKLSNPDGSTMGLIGLATDVTGRKQAEERLRLTAKVFENALEGILITDADNNIVEINAAFTRITGYARDEVIGKNPRVLSSGRQGPEFYEMMWKAIKGTGYWVGEIWNRRKSGEVFPEALTISTVTGERGEAVNYVGIFSDISMLKQHEKQLEHTAHFDALTGIPNRVLLADRMKQALAHAKRNKSMLAVCYLDLDGFKPINDTLGHEAGDRILIEIARRIGSAIRGDDTVARLGGDEFVVLLLDLERPEECVRSLNRLLEAISVPIEVGGRLFTLSASVGVTLYPVDDEDADTLLRHADQAMYSAKQSGRNRYHLYDPEHDQRTRAHHALLAQISQGLGLNQFELYYQPKVNMRTRQLAGAEALIRWRHPERGLLAPGEFLRAVEGTALEIEMGEWVVATALAQLAQWRQDGLALELSINISAFHLQSPDFAGRLRQQLSAYPELPARHLQIEILETAALEDVAKVTAIIEACRAAGVSFALDDFGTGYSSLSYLSSLPVDTLKIDQSFVRDMLKDKGDHAIVQGIIALAHAFERETVAEGIETTDIYQALLDMGCEVGQGYGIARPMPPGEFLQWSKKAGA